MLEVGRAMTGLLGLGQPQLDALEGAVEAAGGLLGVGHAMAGRHEVQLASAQHLRRPEAVAMQ